MREERADLRALAGYTTWCRMDNFYASVDPGAPLRKPYKIQEHPSLHPVMTRLASESGPR